MPNRACAILVLASLAASSAEAATLTEIATEKGTMILLKGEISQGDAAYFAEFLRAAKAEGQVISGVQLDSPGGNFLAGMSLARFVHTQTTFSTAVAAGATCASACFLVFAAGHEKSADYESLVGVHGVANKFGEVTEATEEATFDMARLCRELGVPSDIRERLVATPPNEIVWLNSDELHSMGAVLAGRPIQASRGTQRDSVVKRADQLSNQVSASPVAALPATQSQMIKRAFGAAERGDYQSAIKIWRILAEQGHGPSQYNLGQMYYTGKGVPQDFAQAVQWYQSAADKGIADARLHLGVAYAMGRGVPQDLAKAYRWLRLATKGYANEQERLQAAKALDLVASRMTTDERDAIQKEMIGSSR